MKLSNLKANTHNAAPKNIHPFFLKYLNHIQFLVLIDTIEKKLVS
jgi:hypothetical protein